MNVKNILRYWAPPIAWMSFIFPVGNRLASSSRVYEITVAIIRRIWPEFSHSRVEFLYVVVRKSFHFIEYALLAYLLFLAFRGISQKAWDFRWVAYAGLITVGYGALDEFIQSFMKTRNGSIVDVAVDSSGVIFVLGIVLLRRNRIKVRSEQVNSKQ